MTLLWHMNGYDPGFSLLATVGIAVVAIVKTT